MVDKITKAINKLSDKDRKKIKQILAKVKQREFESFDIKKLKGYVNIYRVRVGIYRIIFQIKSDNTIKVLELGKRDDRRYKNL
jgi:mRNA interferase RelE/StbE